MEARPKRVPVLELPGGTGSARWLTGSVLGFGLASFLSDAGHEAATSVLPAFLAALGAAPAALGVLEGVSDGLASLAKIGGGWLADRAELRKPLAVGGYLTTGISTGLFALAASWAHVLVARAAGWFARGVRGPARDAMLADAVPAEALGRAFGFHRAMDTAGAVAGPLAAMALVSAFPLRAVLGWSAAPGVLAAVVFAVLVRPSGRRPPAGRTPFRQSLRALPHPFRPFLLAVLLFGAGDFARTLLILRAIQLLSPGMGASRATAAAAALYVMHNAIYALGSYPVGHVADSISPKRLLVAGYLLGVVTAALAALATPSLPLLVALFAVAGLTVAFEDTLEGTLVAIQVPPALRGTGYGALAATNGVGDLLSSSLVGLIWTAIGPTAAFGAAAVLCSAGALALAGSRS